MNTTNTKTVTSETAPPGTTYRGEKFSCIIADPPWQAGQLGKHGAQGHYDLMSLERIKALPVNDLAADNAHLYLWCYPATRYVAEDVMRAWGFEYKDEFVWGKDQFGLGHYFRHAHETLLIGVKGKLPVQFRGQRSFMMLARQSHSHKPEEIHVMAQRMSPGPFLELFARRRALPHWKVWGLEVDSDIVIPDFPVPSDARHRQGAPRD